MHALPHCPAAAQGLHRPGPDSRPQRPWRRPCAAARRPPPASCAAGPAAAGAASRSGASTLVKICGITNPEDARVAVEAGADFVGMIMWQKAKRAVSDDTAAAIAGVARAHGAQAVGVFVDEDARTIVDRCQRAGITVAQLHGDGARAGLAAVRAAGLQVVYVQHVAPEGAVQTAEPAGGVVEWVLLDGLQGGSGVALDWAQLRPPACASAGWLLAGGLGPANVASAIATARPTAVDVSSGVCGPDGLQKDAAKVLAFVEAVKGAR